MEKLQVVLDAYFKAWNDGFESKNGDEIRSLMSRNFIGYWCHAKLDKPEEYDYTYDLNGVLAQYGTAEKHFEVLSITERNDGNEVIVFGRERNIVDGVTHPAQVMFIWRKEESKWRLIREYIELEK